MYANRFALLIFWIIRASQSLKFVGNAYQRSQNIRIFSHICFGDSWRRPHFRHRTFHRIGIRRIFLRFDISWHLAHLRQRFLCRSVATASMNIHPRFIRNQLANLSNFVPIKIELCRNRFVIFFLYEKFQCFNDSFWSVSFNLCGARLDWQLYVIDGSR